MEPWLAGIIRQADLVFLVVDLLSENMLEETEAVFKKLEQSKIELSPEEKEVNPLDGIAHKKTMILANKNESKESEENLSVLKDLYGQRFPIFSVSAKEKKNLEELKKRIFESLSILRVYTKVPSKKADLMIP